MQVYFAFNFCVFEVVTTWSEIGINIHTLFSPPFSFFFAFLCFLSLNSCALHVVHYPYFRKLVNFWFKVFKARSRVQIRASILGWVGDIFPFE